MRATIADRKLAAEDWINVHRIAHGMGIRSNATMLYGHVESDEDRVEHLGMLRDLQDETGGFLAYIPLAYHPDHNELGETLGRTGTATTGFDDLRNIAVGRLFLDNFAHIKTHWIMVTPSLSQIALHLRRERHRGHGGAREGLSRGGGDDAARRSRSTTCCGLIRGAGRVPVERDSLYQRDPELRRRASAEAA